jgi:hypothetical protein
MKTIRRNLPDPRIVTRNGAPCQVISLEIPRLPRIGRVCVPSPVPPSPYVFRSLSAAERVMERTQAASRRLRESILCDYIHDTYPHLRPLLTTANYEVAHYAPPTEKTGGNKR